MRTCIALVLLFAIANASLETIMLRKSFSKNVERLNPTDQERAGGWQNVRQIFLNFQKVSPAVFTAQNANVLNEANMAIANKFDPEANGFTFEKVLDVQDQIVSGVNYNVVLEYSNGQGAYQVYDVVLFIVPWNPSANQVVKCNLIKSSA